MSRRAVRVLIVLSASSAVGIASGLAIGRILHAHPAPRAQAIGPEPMALDPNFAKPNTASHRIDIAFPTANEKTPAGAVILPRDAAGRVVLDVMRQGYNNMPIPDTHRALVQFFPAVPPGQKRGGVDLVPLHEFELPAMTLRPGGVDNFNGASREGFVVPPGDYSLVVATAAPAGPKLSPRLRFIEKSPKDIWSIGHSARYPVSVR